MSVDATLLHPERHHAGTAPSSPRACETRQRCHGGYVESPKHWHVKFTGAKLALWHRAVYNKAEAESCLGQWLSIDYVCNNGRFLSLRERILRSLAQVFRHDQIIDLEALKLFIHAQPNSSRASPS